MNQAQKEEYLREYSILKNEGKPFFPYAVTKDGAMAVIVMIVIIFLALMFGAALGPKAVLFLLLPFRGPARHAQPPEVHADGDDRRADHLHDPAVPPAVLRP